ncbi:hypothetical protein LG201_13135 [Methylobacillus gramineus]|uniref:hypothetical protein n=1 Tax=Methylobacillus gramineus TaxID=755169 RepID=UPI001CFFA56E|nr:hypothetical protein [Methylobacillus gramineus]MCB5186152.1 hypothetical protein [Methylobacillus gramineus]
MYTLDNEDREESPNEIYGKNIALTTMLDLLLLDEINTKNYEFIRLQTLIKSKHAKLPSDVIVAIDQTFSAYKLAIQKWRP